MTLKTTAVIVAASLMLTILAGFVFSPQQVHSMFRTIGSAVWGS